MSQFYSPFSALNELHRELNRVFDNRYDRGNEQALSYEGSNWVPQVDISEDEQGFRVHADIPGVDPKDVDITLDSNVLTIKGSRKTEASEEKNGIKRRERISGTFIRQFTLPDTADGQAITAKADNGVLEVSIPKMVKAQPLSIAVNAN